MMNFYFIGRIVDFDLLTLCFGLISCLKWHEIKIGECSKLHVAFHFRLLRALLHHSIVDYYLYKHLSRIKRLDLWIFIHYWYAFTCFTFDFNNPFAFHHSDPKTNDFVVVVVFNTRNLSLFYMNL